MNEQATYSALIKTEARRLGFSDCGISRAGFLKEDAVHLEAWLDSGYNARMEYMEKNNEKRADPTQLVEGAKSVISVILNYYPNVQQEDPEAPIVSKYAYGKDYHIVIKDKLHHLLSFIREKIPGATGRVFTDSAPILEHAWAQRSGLGWIGKNSLLLTTKFGSFVFIGEIIINSELEYDQSTVHDLCGSCRNCIDACPTGAIVTERVVDAGKCISYHTIENKTPDMPEGLRDAFKNRVFGCDICQDVCPWNQRISPHNIPEFEPVMDFITLKREDWMQLNEEKYTGLFKDTAIERAGYKGLKRNIEFIGKR